MADYSYNCLQIRIVEVLDFEDKHGRHVLFCTFQCENENGHLLDNAKAVVVTDGEKANIEKYVENILPDSASDIDFAKLDVLCNQAPDYTFSNPESVAAILDR